MELKTKVITQAYLFLVEISKMRRNARYEEQQTHLLQRAEALPPLSTISKHHHAHAT